MKLEELVADLDHSRKVAPYVKDTAFSWFRVVYKDEPPSEWELSRSPFIAAVIMDHSEDHDAKYEVIPAPTLAELWAELPDEISMDMPPHFIEMTRNGNMTIIYYSDHDIDGADEMGFFKSTNPANAVADLLEWVMGRK